MSALEEKLEDVAGTPVLLVASDFDGTIAPIVDNPGAARPLPGCVEALRALAGLRETHVAIISGRALKALTDLVGSPGHFTLVGSHGSEFRNDLAATLPERAITLLDRAGAELDRVAAETPGSLVERKPASVAFHYRNSSDADADRALRRVVAGPAQWPGVLTHHGKRVVELSVIEASKGAAITMLRRRIGATAVVFLGDDQTDENGFAVLSGSDLGIKVGQGRTLAAHRVDDVQAVCGILERLARWRRAREG